MGPRQVDKTTAVQRALAALPATTPRHYATSDAVFRSDWSWIERQWQEAIQLGSNAVLVLDDYLIFGGYPGANMSLDGNHSF